jgi:uncharacterized membrane protein YcaP (DUF421 family)
MFFHTWSDIIRIVVVATLVFAMMVALLRVVGQQALAKMSGYGIVVTITLGSIVATVIMSRQATLSDAAAAVITLLALQEITRWFQARYLRVHHTVREAPRVMLWNGQLYEERLRAASMSADEVRAAVRQAGIVSLTDVRAVILENDGEWSVIPMSAPLGDESALFGIEIPGRAARGHPRDANTQTADPRRLP